MQLIIIKLGFTLLLRWLASSKSDQTIYDYLASKVGPDIASVVYGALAEFRSQKYYSSLASEGAGPKVDGETRDSLGYSPVLDRDGK